MSRRLDQATSFFQSPQRPSQRTNARCCGSSSGAVSVPFVMGPRWSAAPVDGPALPNYRILLHSTRGSPSEQARDPQSRCYAPRLPPMPDRRTPTSRPSKGVALAFLLLAAPAPPILAYIDPGTGSALVYVVTGLLVSLVFALRGLGFRLIELAFRSRFRRQSCELAVHSEAPRYEITFLPVLRELSRLGVETTYFTMYDREGFEDLPGGVTHVAIPPGMVGYAYLNHLDAKMLVTTTPQLDVMTFRRSRRVGHYCHIPHALGESLFVRPFAYDHFDSVLCCGPILRGNIRKIEFVRKARAKDLYETGVPHYDVLLQSANPARDPEGEPTVLVAPSWGPLSLFAAFGTEFLEALVSRFRVLVRPHPQMRVSQPDLWNEVLRIPGVEPDTSTTPASAMSRADVLLSDFSGIVHEFAFLYRKPVFYLDHDVDLGGMEGQLIGGRSELRDRCREFLIPVRARDLDRLSDRIQEVLTARRGLSREILRVRDETVFHVGRAAPVAAHQIEGILACL